MKVSDITAVHFLLKICNNFADEHDYVSDSDTDIKDNGKSYKRPFFSLAKESGLSKDEEENHKELAEHALRMYMTAYFISLQAKF